MRKERMNNKGFSLVELIIVIAIMAILAAALAPQLMKYIEKSRVSTDASSCSSIESCVNAALANEDAYKEIADKATTTTAGAGGKKDFEFWIKKSSSGTGPEFTGLDTGCDEFKKELQASLSSIKDPKQTGMNYYKVTIVVSEGEKDNTGISSGTSSKEKITEVGDIKVQTTKTNS